MPGIYTATEFYRRGVPNNFKLFGALANASYSIFQPSGRPDLRSTFFKKRMTTIISTTR